MDEHLPNNETPHESHELVDNRVRALGRVAVAATVTVSADGDR